MLVGRRFLLRLVLSLGCVGLHELHLGHVGSCVDARVELCLTEVLVVVLHELAASIFVECRLREWNYQQTLDDLENVRQRPLLGVPVSLESVDADISAGRSYIGVEDLGQEVSFRWFGRELSVDN